MTHHNWSFRRKMVCLQFSVIFTILAQASISYASDHIRIGHEAIFRLGREHQQDGHHILREFPVAHTGNTSLWTAYILPGFNNSEIRFQIWRQKDGLFHLVGQTETKQIGNIIGPFEFELSMEEMIQVQPGDFMGFEYKHGNPIPYELDETCGETSDMQIMDCRTYSLQVEVVFANSARHMEACMHLTVGTIDAKLLSPVAVGDHTDNCWLLTTPPGGKIEAIITDLDLGACHEGSLLINDGEASQELCVYSGSSDFPMRWFVTTGSTMYIHFRILKTPNSKRGFALKYRRVTGENYSPEKTCSRLVAKIGTATPLQLDLTRIEKGFNRCFVIQSPTTNKITFDINLQNVKNYFQEMGLEFKQDKPYIQIYAGTNRLFQQTPLLEINEGHKFFEVKGPVLVVATWEVIKVLDQYSSLLHFRYAATLDFPTDSCSKVVVPSGAKKGNIKWPDEELLTSGVDEMGSFNYAPNQLKCWHLQNEDTGDVRINDVDHDTEASISCITDNVLIFEDQKSISSAKSVCGKGKTNINMAAKSLYVVFTSDRQVQGKGFSVNFEGNYMESGLSDTEADDFDTRNLHPKSSTQEGDTSHTGTIILSTISCLVVALMLAGLLYCMKKPLIVRKVAPPPEVQKDEAMSELEELEDNLDLKPFNFSQLNGEAVTSLDGQENQYGFDKGYIYDYVHNKYSVLNK